MLKRNVLITIAAIIGAGFLFLVFNLDQPIVRNSFTYAKAAKNIIDHGFNPLPVIADTGFSQGKPIGFSLLSVPLVSLLGVNAGLKVASFLGTTFLLCVAYFFFVRMNRRANIESRFIPLELALLFFNPLFFYQFWSAYPDSLFAGLILLAFVLADVIAVEHEHDTRAHIVLLGLIIYAAILTRFYALILGIAIPVYLLMHLRSFLKRSTHVKSKMVLLALVFSVLGVAVVLAKLGRNPTLSLVADARDSGGVSSYLAGLMDPSGAVLVSSIVLFIFALVLNLHFSLFFLLRRANRPGWPVAPACFAGIYLLGLLPFFGTSYNMRFFLPLFAFVVVAIVSGMLSLKKGLRRGVLITYVGAASFLTLNYNVGPFYEHFLTFNEKVAEPVLDRHRRLDNLRIDQHLDFSEKIEQINGVIEPGGVLYWASTYYGSATHGIVEELGVRNDIVVQYVFTAREIPAIEKAVYFTRYRSGGRLSGLQDRFVVGSLGSGLFRLTPLRIELTSPVKDYFDRGASVSLTAKVSTSSDARVLRVEFLMNGVPTVVDTKPPYESNWHATEKGRYVATARVHDSEDNVALSAPKTVFVGRRALERYIAGSTDDVEELADGSLYRTSSDLDLTTDRRRGDQIVGLRFADIRIPRGVEIKTAYLQFTADEVSKERTDLTIHAELASNAGAFTEVRLNVSSRKRASVSLSWSPEPWEMVGESSRKQRTPDLSALIQEVIAQQDWKEGNAMVFVISGSGRRVAVSYEGGRERMPRLYIERP